MEDNLEIKKLLLKFIAGDCTPEEVDKVVLYFQAAKQTDDFPSVVDVMGLIEETPQLDETKSKQIVRRILLESRNEKVSKGSFWKYASIAALFIGLIGLGIFYQQTGFSNHGHDDIVVPKNDAITLKLDNGEIKVIDENASEAIVSTSGKVIGQQNQTKLKYEGYKESDELVYNTLSIPYGKRFDIELSDGTIVYLNAGSSIKYPVNFIKGMKRQVFLTGEAYLEVARNEENPFIVNADELNVHVLGTKFNISNYPEDKRAEVVLVEGSVGMYSDKEDFDKNRSVILSPGLKGTFNENTSEIETKEVSTKVYTAWVGGELVFRDVTFDNILKKLERNYNVTIYNSNRKLGRKPFNASFKEGDINEVLHAFKKHYGIEYSIINNEVRIN
ncbi:FecR family protein [Arenibacter sp. M-2]|uniref:FecR family protein n=1 Tax=Arenibacter sp. M-2 TaxID=3053612 RepID=UPI002570F9E9|nr:FecR family protein [Arenibacter sp. M-2]MDL5514943.1 FecR family protein [Arenibacter sp. M-2]